MRLTVDGVPLNTLEPYENLSVAAVILDQVIAGERWRCRSRTRDNVVLIAKRWRSFDVSVESSWNFSTRNLDA